jgi:hypothetical protein
MDAAWTFIKTSLSPGTGGLILLIHKHQVLRICDKQLLSSFFIPGHIAKLNLDKFKCIRQKS